MFRIPKNITFNGGDRFEQSNGSQVRPHGQCLKYKYPKISPPKKIQYTASEENGKYGRLKFMAFNSVRCQGVSRVNGFRSKGGMEEEEKTVSRPFFLLFRFFVYGKGGRVG